MKDDFPTLDDDENPPKLAMACFEFDGGNDTEIEGSKILVTETAVDESQNYNEEIVSTEEFISEKKKENFCREMTTTVEVPKSDFSYD